VVEKGSQPETPESERSAAGPAEDERVVAGLPEAELGLGELRDRVPAEIRTVSFPVSVRGYSKQAVDDYVEKVNRVIAELEVSRSPRSAVRHALDRVTEQVRGILEQAREAAEQITATAREEAEQTTSRAKAEAAELVVDASADADRTRAEADELLASTKREAEATLSRSRAEAEDIVAGAQAEAAEHQRRSEEELSKLRKQAEAELEQLQRDTDEVQEARGRLLGDIRDIAARLEELAGEAASRFPSPEAAEAAQPSASE
jgi:DivIVA domain-containing protein